MSAFATLYGLAKDSNQNIKVGIDYNQFKILSMAFPYFEIHFDEFLMDSWYCGIKTSNMNWFQLGIIYKTFEQCETQFLHN